MADPPPRLSLVRPGPRRRGRFASAFWHDIGAAWEHQDGKGFNAVLQLLPNQGQKIVMRINEPRDSAEE
jgi:hypothetical protein